MAGARKPRGKIIQPHKFGASSATFAAVASLAGFSVIVAGIGSPSISAVATSAKARKYLSGDTGTLPSHTEVGTRPCLRRKSATSTAVRPNWLASVVTG